MTVTLITVPGGHATTHSTVGGAMEAAQREFGVPMFWRQALQGGLDAHLQAFPYDDLGREEPLYVIEERLFNPTPVGIFATPDSMEALQDYIGKFSGGEAIVANTILGMTWNLVCKLVHGEGDNEHRN